MGESNTVVSAYTIVLLSLIDMYLTHAQNAYVVGWLYWGLMPL